MHFDESQRPSFGAPPCRLVRLSPWVNEPLPPIEELLTARDVARLTRRTTLARLGRLPRQRRYHGRSVGWLRSDVLYWLARIRY